MEREQAAHLVLRQRREHTEQSREPTRPHEQLWKQRVERDEGHDSQQAYTPSFVMIPAKSAASGAESVG